MKRHKVLMLNDDLDLGGVQRLIVDFSNGLVERGLDVGILASPGGQLWGDLDGRVRRCDSYWHSGKNLPQRARLGRALRRLVVQDGYRIVHAHQRGVAIVARVALSGTGVRVVEHVHSEFYSSWLGAKVSFRGHRLIACGSAVLNMLTQQYGRPRSRVTLVQNSVTDNWFGEVLDLPCRATSKIRVLAVGSLLDVKDPLRFARVMSDVSARCSRISAEWVGDGPLRAQVDRHSEQIDFAPAFSGASAEVKQKLLEADVLMLTSRREGLPLVVLEAMALGRPVIAPDVGSCRDAVDSGVNGVLYPKEISDEELVRLVIDCADVEKLSIWGAASRERFESLGDLSRVINELVEVYDRVEV